MANVLAKLFTYGVDGVEGEPTTFLRNVVQLVGTVKQQLLKCRHGEPEIFVEGESISS